MLNEDKSLRKVDGRWEMTTEYFFLMARRLEKHSVIFSEFLEMGKPTFIDDKKRLPTAAVGFDAEGDCIMFLFNVDYWNGLTDYDRTFIITHEMLHIILGHGRRFSRDQEDTIGQDRRANIAQDLVINHMIDYGFRISRQKTSPIISEEACWIDTVFGKRRLKDGTTEVVPQDKVPPIGKNYEHYYNLLPVQEVVFLHVGGIGKDGKPQEKESGKCLDHHKHYNISKEDYDKLIDKLDKGFSSDAKEELGEMLEKHDPDSIADEDKEAGNEAGGKWHLAKKKRVKKKRKWETIIKNWTVNKINQEFSYTENWVRENRRLAAMGDTGVILPSNTMLEDDVMEKDKIEVWFFQDTSGSCVSYADRFFHAAETIPHGEDDPFQLRLFCFDTKVYPVDEKDRKLQGFGGTSFSILEAEVRRLMEKENIKRHPTVFVITDGYGDQIDCKKPKLWYWFLTENSSTNCIPKDCHKFDLKDYE